MFRGNMGSRPQVQHRPSVLEVFCGCSVTRVNVRGHCFGLQDKGLLYFIYRWEKKRERGLEGSGRTPLSPTLESQSGKVFPWT